VGITKETVSQHAMTDPRIQQLLEDLMESGRTPEEVCHAYPELLLEVQERWRCVRITMAEAEALFPAEREEEATLDELTPSHREVQRPQVPGYDVLEVLGRGGMGVVYKARHQRLNRVVAIKVLRCGDHAAPKELAGLVREAQSIARLKHPNIVQVHDVGDFDGLPYFTMEFVEGGSLAQKLSGEPQPAMKSAEWVSVLARAVHAAHDRGIVHRDLKPGNVLVSADGTLKISDFGLARRFGNDETVVSVAARVGTPSYMPPEQALGAPAAFEPTADIYSVGAILYEMLTGRPPFRGESPAETERQVISDEPVPPQRLNPRTPRDLQTICLKCLQKSPERRYRSASELADDLDRFRRGEPIRARRVGRTERALRWGRRKPAAAMLLVTATALAGLASGGGVWFVQQRAERRAETARNEGRASQAVEARLEQAAAFVGQGRWREARTALDIAPVVLDSPAHADLRDRLRRASADLDLVERLDAARIQAWAVVQEMGRPADSDPLFASALEEAGLGREGEDAEAVAARIRGSAVRDQIVAALDAWAGLTADTSRREWVLEVARCADSDPVRDQLRRPELWEDGAELTRLVQQLGTSEERVPTQLASALGRMARANGGDVVDMLNAAQARFPQDFWLNYEVGWALQVSKRSDEAIGYYRAALAVRPETSEVHSNLGLALYDSGRRHEALEQYRQALRFDPESAAALINLGTAFRDQGQRDEAIRLLEEALRYEPDSVAGHLSLGMVLRDQGLREEAMTHFQRAVSKEPDCVPAQLWIGVALHEAGRLDEAIQHHREAMRLDPTSVAAHLNLGMSLNAQGRKDEAIEKYREAIRMEPENADAHEKLGSMLLETGRREQGFEQLRLAIRIAPDAANPRAFLGKGLYQDGRLEEALDQFQQALRLDPANVSAQNWLRLAAYPAARAAIREAAVTGSEGPGVSARADKRRQALTWLRASLELAANGKGRDAFLPDWQRDPTFAAVRNPQALATLPGTEREEWQRLWADVAAAIAADPLAQGQLHIAHREWKQAADCYARRLALSPTDNGLVWYEYAAVSLLAGDRPGYDKACAHLFETAGKPGGPRPYHLARACTLIPDGRAEDAARVAEVELAKNANLFWSLTEQGALAYRTGQFEESASLFERSLQADEKPGRAVVNWFWLALTDQKLGRGDDASLRLAKAQAWLDQFADGMPANADADLGLHLHNWLEAQVLRREAETAIISG
jgi:eukaryotic-like serine/threonine-protein kinase